jgi:hypothetical protein
LLNEFRRQRAHKAMPTAPQAAVYSPTTKLAHDFYLVEVTKPADVKTPRDNYNVVEKITAEDAYLSLSQSECPLLKASAN